ncbi:hypothetical protein HJFPF1_02519 [Paramyrothecium foliicola]|nr:hypothetical protein HJFPF1_02519 [Paramyrothecium foliicola]
MEFKPNTVCVIEVPFAKLSEALISHAGLSPCRFRFLDCRTFAQRESLRLLEFSELPAQDYSAVSYVWRGLKTSNVVPSESVAIEGADGADPISIEVLRLACVTSLYLKCNLLWLDGLCIIQSDDEDKAWQIQRMHNIYKSCKECIVIPNGLSALANLWDESNWIYRAWTLQEAIAPPNAKVLFLWELGHCQITTNFPLGIIEVESKTAAIADMKQLLEQSSKGTCRLVKFDERFNRVSEETCPFKLRLLGGGSIELLSLIGALDFRGQDGADHAIWRSSFMRSAKYPVDMIFSIMGLMGVTLDTTKYARDDRRGATIDLMREILRKGGRAEWLGMATQMPINATLSTVPAFPHPNPSGKAVVAVNSVDRAVSGIMDSWFWLENVPRGRITEEGYFQFEADSIAVLRRKPDEPGLFLKTTPGDEWVPQSELDESHTYAIIVGRKEQYLNGIRGLVNEPPTMVAMVVEGHQPGKFHNVGYAFVGEDIFNAPGWIQRPFKVGSPAA